MNKAIADRFPGAVVLDEREFASTIVGHAFRYREVGSEIIVDRPKEVFLEGGRYEFHGLRAIAHGTYSIKHGVVSIVGPTAFLGLDNDRIFFRQQGRLLTASSDGKGSIIELISES